MKVGIELSKVVFLNLDQNSKYYVFQSSHCS